ncbi:uncharacterized protein PV09_03977 [Verruconis gallopava]|uniref:Uncharacterized protein n=1 Tax=Verruconis gallopava TaxID=253628 RepID=A0A0D2AE99_9PEZI|nr:uncharacterized protein PV09_03977 [Verruconis gallopava]KIW04790.1 hypothetical protein PV09_03977 [Verruconis gallopava]
MFKGNFFTILSLTAAFGALAAPIAIPFTGLTADLHMKRGGIIPVLEIRDSIAQAQSNELLVRDSRVQGHKRDEIVAREADIEARDSRVQGHKRDELVAREADIEARDSRVQGH